MNSFLGNLVEKASQNLGFYSTHDQNGKRAIEKNTALDEELNEISSDGEDN